VRKVLKRKKLRGKQEAAVCEQCSEGLENKALAELGFEKACDPSQETLGARKHAQHL